MPRTYKNKNVHTKPSKSGVKNMTKEFDAKHKDSEDDNLMGDLRGLFGRAIKGMGRTSAWTGDILASEIDGYFAYCQEKNLKPCKSGIRLYLSVSKAQYYSWQTESSKYGVISDLINYANDMMESQYIGRAEKYPTANLFLLRTSHSHVETSKVDVNTDSASTSVDDVKDIINKLGLDKPKE